MQTKLNEQIEIITDYVRQTEHDNFIEFLDENRGHNYDSHVYYNLMIYDCLNGGEVFFNEVDHKVQDVEALNVLIDSYLKGLE